MKKPKPWANIPSTATLADLRAAASELRKRGRPIDERPPPGRPPEYPKR